MAVKYLHAVQTQRVPNGTQLSPTSALFPVWPVFGIGAPFARVIKPKSLLAPCSRSLITTVLVLLIAGLMPFPSLFLSDTNLPHCSNSLLQGVLALFHFSSTSQQI